MNRDKALEFLASELVGWGEGLIGGGWTFIDDQYVHTFHAPINIDDWNRVKIKNGAFVKFSSDEECDYIESLLLGSKATASETCFVSVGGSIHFPSYHESNEEIFIEMPKAKDETIATGAVGRMVTLNIPEEEETNINAKVLAEKIGSKHPHYFKDVSDLDEVDVYRVCVLFEVNDPSGAIQHAVKKLLCPGQRGAKDERKDLEEARDTINRKLEMMGEDNQ